MTSVGCLMKGEGGGEAFSTAWIRILMHDCYSLLHASHGKWSTGKMEIMDTITIKQIKNFECKTTLPHLENSLSSTWKNEHVLNYPSQWCFRFTFFLSFRNYISTTVSNRNGQFKQKLAIGVDSTHTQSASQNSVSW